MMARKAVVRWSLLSILGLTAVGIVVVLLLPRPIDVDTAVVTRGSIAETVADEGMARVRDAYVISAPIAAHVERIEIEVGDRVKAGQTIVARLRPVAADFLDPRARAQAEAAIASARALLAAAVADRERLAAEGTRADAELARTTMLVKTGAAALQDLDNAKAAAATAHEAIRAAEATSTARQADVSAAESTLTGPSAQALQSLTVVSPASGVVTHVLQQSERTVAAGNPLVEIGDTGGLEAQIEFLSEDAVKIRPGQAAEIYNWGGPGVIPAEVRRVEPQGFTKVSALGVEEQRVLVLLQFTGPEARWSGLAPGYRVWGRVFLRRAPAAVIVPVGVLVRSAEGWAGFRLEAGRAHLRPLEIGAITDAGAELLGGAAVGDRFVLFPSDQVRDGVRARPRP
jgi:HlyD family secretion protein